MIQLQKCKDRVSRQQALAAILLIISFALVCAAKALQISYWFFFAACWILRTPMYVKTNRDLKFRVLLSKFIAFFKAQTLVATTACLSWVITLVEIFVAPTSNFMAESKDSGEAFGTFLAAFICLLSNTFFLISSDGNNPDKVTELVNNESSTSEARLGGQRKRKMKTFCNAFWKVIMFLLILGFLYQDSAAIATVNLYPPPGQLYAVSTSSRFKLHLHCNEPEGFDSTKNPTVLLFHGWRGSSVDLSWIHLATSKHTRTCSFDRLGAGWSDPSALDHPRDSATMAGELIDVLDEAGIQGNFIIAGHSFAGLNMPAFIQKTRLDSKRNVTAMVMIDAVDWATQPTRGYDKFAVNSPLNLAGLYIVPVGIARFIFDCRLYNLPLIYDTLPSGAGVAVVRRLSTSRYFSAFLAEWKYWPWSVQTAWDMEQQGAFQNMSIFVYAGLQGVNSQKLIRISNSSELYVFNEGHFFPLQQVYADQISSRMIEYLNTTYTIIQ
jgi:pimeloyl-ACP methyl ester carboxylesterase